MATNKITFIAELKDRLTGPTKSVQRAVEDLANATQKAGQTAAAGLGKAEKAAEDHGRKATSAHGKAGRAAEGSATRTGRAAGRMEQAFQKIDGRAGRMATAMGRHSGAGATAIERASGRMGRALGKVDAAGAASKFGRGMDRMASHAATAASKIETAMNRAGKAIGLAVGALGTASIIGGGTRLMDIENAGVKLEVMGYDEPTQASIMGTVEKSVIGTPFGLGEAAKVGTQLLGSGVGTDLLEDRLQTTVNVASLYGNGDLGDISTVLSQIQAKGRLMGEEALQLNERGMPVYDWIAQAKDMDKSEVADLISEGGVTSDDFWEAMAPRVAGGSQMMGETFKGVFANMRTAFSRAGAQFLEPIMDPLKDLMGEITGALKGAAPFFTALGERVAPGIAAAAEHAPKLAAALEPLGGPLLAAAGSFANLLPEIVQGLTLWFMILGLVLPPLLNLVSFIADLTGPFLPILIPLLMGAGAAFTTWKVISTIAPLLGGLTKGLGLLSKVILGHPILWIPLAIYAVVKGLEWLYENVGWVRDSFDWLGDSVRGVLGFFDDLGAKISDLIEDKFPRLHSAATTALTFGDGSGAAGSQLSWAERAMGYGAVLGEWLGLPDVGGNREERSRLLLEEDLPHHADGGFTASGAHKAWLGEEGREFVVDHWATEKLASIPGALPAISQGKVPFRPVPVPVGAGAGGTQVGGDTVTFNIFDARDPNAVVAVVRAELDRRNREKRLTNNTLAARGAR